MTLDFEKALISPQEPEVILQCKNSSVSKPTWLNDGSIAMLQRKSARRDLIKYRIDENNSTEIYTLQEGNIIDYAYSPQKELIVITRFDRHGAQHVDLINTDGRLLSSHPIELPAEIPASRPVSPSFSPLENQLLFSTGKQLFTLSYEGEVKKISLPFSERMVQPVFHPGQQTPTDGERPLRQ